MASNPTLWSERPIAEDLLQYAAEDVLQLLMLADRITADLGTCHLRLLSALSARYSHWYWEPVHRDAASCLVGRFSDVLTSIDRSSWLAEIATMTGPASLHAPPSGTSTPQATSGFLLAINRR